METTLLHQVQMNLINITLLDYGTKEFHMSTIKIIATLQLNNPELLEEWKVISADINEDLKNNARGFISRESGIDADGLVYCILEWESREASEKFRKGLSSRPDFMEKMEDFSRVVNMESMTKKIVDLF